MAHRGLPPHDHAAAATLIGRCRQNLFTTLCLTTLGFTTLAAGAAVLTTSGAGAAGASAAGAGTSAAGAGRAQAPAKAKPMRTAPIRCLITIGPSFTSFLCRAPHPDGSRAR